VRFTAIAIDVPARAGGEKLGRAKVVPQSRERSKMQNVSHYREEAMGVIIWAL